MRELVPRTNTFCLVLVQFILTFYHPAIKESYSTHSVGVLTMQHLRYLYLFILIEESDFFYPLAFPLSAL